MIAPTDEMAQLIAAHSSNIYEYHFSTPGNSFHSVELNYVFGAPFSGQFADEMITDGSADQSVRCSVRRRDDHQRKR